MSHFVVWMITPTQRLPVYQYDLCISFLTSRFILNLRCIRINFGKYLPFTYLIIYILKICLCFQLQDMFRLIWSLTYRIFPIHYKFNPNILNHFKYLSIHTLSLTLQSFSFHLWNISVIFYWKHRPLYRQWSFLFNVWKKFMSWNILMEKFLSSYEKNYINPLNPFCRHSYRDELWNSR